MGKHHSKDGTSTPVDAVVITRGPSGSFSSYADAKAAVARAHSSPRRDVQADDSRLANLATQQPGVNRPTLKVGGSSSSTVGAWGSASPPAVVVASASTAAKNNSSSSARGPTIAQLPPPTMGQAFPETDKARRILSPTEAAVFRRLDTLPLSDYEDADEHEDEKRRPDSPGLNRRGGRPIGDSVRGVNDLSEDSATGLPPLYAGVAIEPEVRELFELVMRNDTQGVRALFIDHFVRSRTPVDQRGRTPIMIAAQIGAADTLGVLLVSAKDAVRRRSFRSILARCTASADLYCLAFCWSYLIVKTRFCSVLALFCLACLLPGSSSMRCFAFLCVVLS